MNSRIPVQFNQPLTNPKDFLFREISNINTFYETDLNPNLLLRDILISHQWSQYCLCKEHLLMDTSSTRKPSIELSTLEEEKERKQEDFQIEQKEPRIHSKEIDFSTDRSLYLKSLLENLLESLEKIENEDRLLIFSKKKLGYRSNKSSKRRSQYTGVFKNGRKWQALIAIRSKKTYINTYNSEVEAAKAFD